MKMALNSPKDTICVQCGDGGFSNAFVHCIKCLHQFAVHRYCMDAIPNPNDGFVRWICDDCYSEAQCQPVQGELKLDLEDDHSQNVKEKSNINEKDVPQFEVPNLDCTNEIPIDFQEVDPHRRSAMKRSRRATSTESYFQGQTY